MKKRDLKTVATYKAEASGPNGNCVGMAMLADGTVALFNTGDGDDAPVLRFSPDEWGAFVEASRTGRFIPI